MSASSAVAVLRDLCTERGITIHAGEDTLGRWILFDDDDANDGWEWQAGCDCPGCREVVWRDKAIGEAPTMEQAAALLLAAVRAEIP